MKKSSPRIAKPLRTLPANVLGQATGGASMDPLPFWALVVKTGQY